MTNRQGRTDRLLAMLEQSPFRGDSRLQAMLGSSQFAAVLPVEDVEHLVAASDLSLFEVMDAFLPFAAVFAIQLSLNTRHRQSRGEQAAICIWVRMPSLRAFPVINTVHAEQTAAINAWRHEEVSLTHLAITAAPCGLCRQFLYELNGADQLKILTPGQRPLALPTLLPAAFGPQDLDIKAGLMAAADELSISLKADSKDDVVAATLAAAKRSYAPYSHDYAAVSLVTADGTVFTGRYAENAAFNPSVPPLASALALLRLGGRDPSEVVRAVLVECLDSVGHSIGSRVLLGSVCRVELEVLGATVRAPQLL